MMSIFDEIIFKTKTVCGIAGKKTSEMVELKKLQISAHEINVTIRKKFEALGKLVYDAGKTGNDAGPLAEQNIAEIDDLRDKLLDLQEKIYKLKNLVKCPVCSASNPKIAVYCNRCGSKIVSDEEKGDDAKAAGE